ncbi:MAG: MazG-like protein [Chryseobacterium sp.]|uniref:MazG-like protein n=1 Tax=Pedobacter agri TaxID=454586 RepID=A0A9X3DBG1_9SPHI|nr:MazG-like protein [Pedobacter agri]MCX3264529.1 MazG-like protein [Pedobacter agri]RZJ91723.1 MAG: MazG-like protein [Chryseobacterium sp.]
MENTNLQNIKNRSMAIREKYRELELQHHGTEWNVEEDALAFLSDAGLVGRLVMSQQGRWPKANTDEELNHKLGECIWWLTVLAERMGIDINEATEYFLDKTENLLGNK